MDTPARDLQELLLVPGNAHCAYRYHVTTDVGLVRPNNEDNFLIQPELGLFVVADGMGGHVGGEVASLITSERMGQAVSALGRAADAEPELTIDTADDVAAPGQEADLRFAVWQTQADIRHAMRENPLLDRMGSTLVALYFRGGHVHVLNVGDSRAYRYNYDDKHLEQITQDHSTDAEVEHGGVKRMRRVLTRVVGGGRGTVIPDLFLLHVQPKDCYLLCTDGIWGKLGEAEIQGCMRLPDLKGATEALVKLALQRGSKDNLTALMIHLMEATPPKKGVKDEPPDPTMMTTGE